MYQVLGPKIIVGVASWIAASIFVVLGYFSIPVSARIAVALVDAFLFFVIFANWVWRPLWNKTGRLGLVLADKIYPDLNGTYDVVLESNWPIVKRTLDASRKEAERFDPFSLDQEPPALLRLELEATIEQSWFDIRMRMYPKNTDAVIKSSRTLATIPLSATHSNDKELIYMFEQENENRAPTDEERFCGAARLVIDPANPRRLSGAYWNNRMWQRGVNAAGRITLSKKSNTVVRKR